jgi:hypothetical protein
MSKKIVKKDYPTTDETREVLAGHEIDIAKAKGCNPSYLYNIKNLEEPDPYAPFREWFQFCAIGGGKVRAYLNDLESIACHAEMGTQPLCLITEHAKGVKEDADVAIAVMSGKPLYTQLNEVCEALSQKERQKAAIIEAINLEKDAANGNRSRMPPVRNWAKEQVGAYRNGGGK